MGLLAMPGLPKVIVGLYAQPCAGFANAGQFQANGQVRADRCMAVQDPGQGFTCKTQATSQFGNADAQLGEHVLEQRFARMWRVEHDHGGILLFSGNQGSRRVLCRYPRNERSLASYR
ncbi:hypothetical protein D3C84_748090 [compost metagenome]